MYIIKWIGLACIITCITLSGCGTPDAASSARAKVLRIGVSPDYPPVAFKENDDIVGIEPDMAYVIGKELDRQVRFVEIEFDKLIDALLKGDIDIIMSGMTVTDARKVRIDFANPYVKTGQMALMRRRNAEKYDTPDKIKTSTANIGVETGTTGEAFVKEYCPDAQRVAYTYPRDAMLGLTQTKRIDLFIHDGPAIAWLYSENAENLAGMFTPMTDEYLAWGIRRGDNDLKEKLNVILKQLEQSGALDKVLDHWLPYR